MDRGARRASPRWPTASCSARSSSPDDVAITAPGHRRRLRHRRRPRPPAARARRQPRAARPLGGAGRRAGGRLPRADALVADLADPGTARRRSAARSTDRSTRSSTSPASSSSAPVAELRLADWARAARRQPDRAGRADPRLAARPARGPRGTVVFVNSGAGLTASAEWSAYAASKYGLRALADALRAEEAEHGVRVTTVYPGRTATPMQEKVHEQEGKDVRRRAVDPARDRRRRDPARPRPARRRHDPRRDRSPGRAAPGT